MKVGMPLPCGVDQFDVIEVLLCPNCDALFERGQFMCYGAKTADKAEFHTAVIRSTNFRK
jgi:hypothetical protein